MGIYQLYFLKMHSKLLFLSRNAGTKDPAFLSRVLADTLAAAKEAMRGRNFGHSPYRTKIITLASGAAAALVHLEQGELEKMRGELAEVRGARRHAVNASEFSTGSFRGASDSLFSPAEVRAMSRAEVRENLERIRESMRHWS